MRYETALVRSVEWLSLKSKLLRRTAINATLYKSTNVGALHRVDGCSPSERLSTFTTARLVEPTAHANGRRRNHRAMRRSVRCDAVAFER
jgi:hypothetical protein